MKTFYLILEFIHTLLHHVLNVVRHKNNVSNKMEEHSEESNCGDIRNSYVDTLKKGSDDNVNKTKR